jgi:hypothetical protein
LLLQLNNTGLTPRNRLSPRYINIATNQPIQDRDQRWGKQHTKAQEKQKKKKKESKD